MKRKLLILALWLPSAMVQGQEKNNLFTLDASFMTRGEIRQGGLPKNENGNPHNFAAFIVERTTLSAGYERKWLSSKITAEHSGTWGDVSSSIFSVYEAWLQFSANNGLFAKIGRQELSYDDERIFGSDDWSMSGLSHDALKLGYEGHGHKLHIAASFNQNNSNMQGGTFYENGLQPYKALQTLWYHWDIPKSKVGISLLFTNIGMQGGEKGKDERTFHQQISGTYIKWAPKKALLEGSFYYQSGREEHGLPIQAWMMGFKASYFPFNSLKIYAGYDYLSGDPYFAIPAKGQLGMIRHEVVRGFSSVYGSHHKFYGAMDFFYLSTYVNGFTPGLQNAFAGCKYSPVKDLSFEGAYHYFATATKINNEGWSLGHELELRLSYSFLGCAKISAGYSFMKGTKTMEVLKRTSDNRHLHWGWLMIKVTPRFFQGKW